MITKEELKKGLDLISDNFIEERFYKASISEDSVCLQGTYSKDDYEVFISKGFIVNKFDFGNKMISLKNGIAEIVMFFRMSIEDLFKLKNEMKWN
tara:strand:- start:360 stop:644 length:285 start_codon:yes stop_codon:yes gene_type:complete